MYPQAAHQRRLMEELARPRPQTCTSGVTFGKAKAMASHRPGVNHRRSGRGDDAFVLTRSNKMIPTKLAEANVKEIRPEEPQTLDTTSATLSRVFDPNGGGSGGARRGCTGEMSERVPTVETQRIRSIPGRREGNHSGERRENEQPRAALKSEDFLSGYSWLKDQIELDDDFSFTAPNGEANTAVATEGKGKSSHYFGDISSSRRRISPDISQIVNDSSVQQPNFASALPVSVASAAPQDFAFTRLSADGEGLPELTTDPAIRRRSEEEQLVAGAGNPEVETRRENLLGTSGPSTVLEAELREGWLRDVRLETEVAGLALQVGQ